MKSKPKNIFTPSMGGGADRALNPAGMQTPIDSKNRSSPRVAVVVGIKPPSMKSPDGMPAKTPKPKGPKMPKPCTGK